MTNLTPRTRWEVLPSLPTPRAYSAAVCVDDKIYVFGGCNQMGKPMDAVESFNFETRTWKVLQSLKVKRAQPNALVFNGKIVVIGGCKEMNEPVKEVEVFDPETNEWSELPPVTFSLAFFTVVSHESSIYIFGGMSSHGQCNNITYVLREGKAEWEVCNSMPTQRYAAKAFVCHDQVYVMGGRIFMSPCNAVEIFDVVSGMWDKHPNSLVGRMFPAMVEIRGCIYVIGGLTTDGKFLNDVEVFNTDKKTLTTVTPLQSNRADMSIDKYEKWIIVAGGQGSNGPTNITELYNTEKDYWSSASHMPTARCAAAAVVSGNKFFVIGGMGMQGPCGNFEVLIFD